jgi:hypothetical protein
MLLHSALLIGSGLLINVADAIPRYDIARTCRAAVAANAAQCDPPRRFATDARHVRIRHGDKTPGDLCEV